MDVQQYFNYIGFKKMDDRIAQLKHLQTQHLLHIPFENISIIRKELIQLVPSSLFQKVVGTGRGGICFETNVIIHEVLEHLNYDVSYISAAFWDEEKEQYNFDTSHLALKCVVGNEVYLVDVGIGSGFLEPLKIEDGYEYSDTNGYYRVQHVDHEEWVLLKKENEVWKRLFRFSTESRMLADFYDACTYFQTNTETFLASGMMVSKPTLVGRMTLHEQYFKRIEHGKEEKEHFQNKEQWKKHLYANFKIKL